MSRKLGRQDINIFERRGINTLGLGTCRVEELRESKNECSVEKSHRKDPVQ